jgi:hypothetical protein
VYCFGQQTKKNDQLGVSIPLIYNNTRILNVYSGARAAHITGKAVSVGININYSRDIAEDVFIMGGLGYFNQNFGIVRPFNFDGDTTKYGYHTKRYSYKNINWIVGAGYNYSLKKNYSLRGSLLFNGFYCFNQKYIPVSLTEYAFKNYQVESRKFSFGQMLNLNMGGYRKVTQNVIIGADLVLPVYTRWRKDRIFEENENEYYTSRFSVGANITVKYLLHN